MANYDLIFAAVFPPSTDVDLPTPAATPVLGSTGFGESFGNTASEDAAPVTGAAEQIKWDRAWHTATAYLSLPGEPITAAHARQSENTLRGKWIKPCSPDVSHAISYVVSESSYGRQLRKRLRKEDLFQWYLKEVGTRHYLDHVMPGLVKVF
jgi:anaphase-promoting complex subunit 2